MENKIGPYVVLATLMVGMMSGMVSAEKATKPALNTQQAMQVGIIGGKIGFDDGSSDTKATALLASSCKTKTASIYLTNYLGVRVWTYYQRIVWCYDGTKVTSKSSSAWGEVTIPLNLPGTWAFNKVVAKTESGGVGQTYYKIWTKGHFTYNIAGVVLTQSYPWIEQKVYGNGGYTARWGT